MTPRDAEASRRVATLERGVAPFLVSPEWEPFYPDAQFRRVRQPLAAEGPDALDHREPQRIRVDGRQMTVPLHDRRALFRPLSRRRTPGPARRRRSGPVASRSRRTAMAPFWRLRVRAGSRCHDSPDGQDESMTAHAAGAIIPTSGKPLPQQMIANRANQRRQRRARRTWSRFPAANFDFEVSGHRDRRRRRDGRGCAISVGGCARRFHEHTLDIKPLLHRPAPVTNAEFKKFLDAAHYQPEGRSQFPEGLEERQPIREGWADKPVTWVSLEDARAYAAWAGKRLPHEWEWQYAAQGTDGRAYPWGNDWNAEAVPVPDKRRNMRGPRCHARRIRRAPARSA